MGAFEYNALDPNGRERGGVMEGDTPRHVRQLLRDKGWTPLSVDEVERRGARPGARSVRLRRGIGATQLALVTRQLATLVRAGLPLEEALRATAQQADDNPRVASTLVGVRARVMEGHSLATGLEDFPHIFPALYRTTIAAGERSGHLDLVLDRLADYTEARQQLRQRVQLALIYPVLLSITALLVVIALLAYVVPQVVQVYENVGQQLPWLTRAMIATSDFVRGQGLWIAAALIAGGVLARYVLRREGPQRRFHRLLLRLPLIGRLSRGLNTARFTRTLSILTASGVPILESLNVAGQVLTNTVMREVVEDATARVREGASLHNSLAKGGYFPPMTLHLISSGESSGDLEGMLERAAVNQEREMETLAATLTTMFEPLLIFVMGGLVLLIVIATLLPIFELNQLVR